MLPVPIVIGLNGIFASTRPATLQIRFTALRTRAENEKTRTGCAAVPIPSLRPITSHSVSANQAHHSATNQIEIRRKRGNDGAIRGKHNTATNTSIYDAQ